MNKILDLRFVIGLFFVIVALLLVGHSFFSAETTEDAKTINRWAGLAFGIFGILMVVLSFRKDAHDELT